MSILTIVILIIIAAVCGAIGQALAGYSLGGFVISTVVGFIGALLGTWIANQAGIPELFAVTIDGNTFPILWAIIGSALFAIVVGLLTRPRYVTR
ncbi:MAG: hypothetical protein R3C14_31120 [Caldilineaceae bacterium]